MKILLSAYACEPNKGSEPAVGWQWAVELARLGHDVWVLTRANNRPNIEPAIANLPESINLNFLYYDLPAWARWWKKGGRGVRLYYLLWQWGAYRLAKAVHAKKGFDRVHHVTFVSVRQPSFMGRLGIPFIFGPVAGGERAPWRLRQGYGWRGFILDAIRDAANAMVKLDPFMAQTFRAAEHIFVTSEQTLDLVPRRFHNKAAVQLAIGWKSAKGSHPTPPSRGDRRDGRVNVLFVGRLLHWKGLHLGLAAFHQMLDVYPETRLVVIGRGPERARLRRLTDRLGVANRVEWVPWLSRNELLTLYPRHDIFLYPSLHDSGGMVVLEALAIGLPVVCLDLGGPGIMVDDTCGRVIATEGHSVNAVTEALGEALIELAQNDALRRQLSAGAMQRVHDLSWAALVARIYGESAALQGPGDRM